MRGQSSLGVWFLAGKPNSTGWPYAHGYLGSKLDSVASFLKGGDLKLGVRECGILEELGWSGGLSSKYIICMYEILKGLRKYYI